MMTGHWKPRKMTSRQKDDVNKFYTDVWVEIGLPLNLQRADNKCGNVPFQDPGQKWRAMCDPEGPTPCCYQYICTDATQEQCTCTNCTDMRTLIHAEYATWVTQEPRCQPVKMTVKDICHVLNGYTVVFVGDSLMRHLYIAFLMVIHGDFKLGALKPSSSQEQKQHCHGLYMFPNSLHCSGHIQTNSTACKGKVKTRFLHYYHPDGEVTPTMMIEDVMKMQKLKKVFTVVGFGSHYKMDPVKVQNESLIPLLQNLSRTKSIQKVQGIVDGHALSTVLKSPIYAQQASDFVQWFNKRMKTVLRQYNVPSFDTFNLTSHPLMTFDGSHYGLGVNRVKVVILLNYFLELRGKGLL